MSEHTKLPWTVVTDKDGYYDVSIGGAWVLRDESCGSGGEIEKETNNANTKYIVKACNAYPELVGALHEWVDGPDRFEDNNEYEYRCEQLAITLLTKLGEL